MALWKGKTNGNGKAGAKSERWTRRAEAKRNARKQRRTDDRRAGGRADRED